jgi:uncharacterized protein YjiS (DUF1127 family)
MTCTQLTAASLRPRSTLALRGVRVLRGWWHAYWDWRARKATVLILRSLDCRTLHDIGIHPSEIESLVHARDGDRRRRYDAAWPWRSGGAYGRSGDSRVPPLRE